MKKFKLCLVALATFFLGAQSVSAATEITSGTSYYIQNVGSGLYLCGANNWGTRASVSVQGEMFTTTGSDGVYTLTDVALSSSSKQLGSTLFTDSSGSWTIEAVGDGSFTIKNDNGYLAQSTTAGYHIGYLAEQVASVTDAAKWYILTKDEAIAKLSAATKDVPVDASFLIGNANFSRNHTTVWSMTANNQNLCGGTIEKSEANACAESWRSAFDLNQSFTDLPNGTYELSAQVALTDYAAKYDGNNYAVLYANNESGIFADMDESDRGTNMATLSASFAEKKESNGITPIYQVTISTSVTDGKLTIGVKNTRTDTWCIWDNFQLKYYAPDLTKLNTDLANLVTKAEAISGKMNATVATTLSNAITAAKSCTQTETALNTAYSNLNDAITAAEASVTVYSNINALITSNATSVATLDADGKAAYDVTAVQTAYDNGTITDGTTETTALNAALQTAVKAQTTAGADMTLAITNWDFTGCSNGNFPGWTISAPNGGNTWKNGDHNVEYWIGSAANGQFDYYQEISGLPTGKYTLTGKMWNSTNGEGGATFSPTSGVYGMTSQNIYTYGLVSDDIDNGSMKEYTTDEIFVVDGKLRVGVKNSTTMAARWFGVDYIKLTFVEKIDLQSYYDNIASLLSTASAINDPQISTATALSSAIDASDGYKTSTDLDALNTIKDNLSAAVAASQASVKAYANAATCLPEMKKLVESTNVYTAEALETYYTTPAAKYEAKTLTTEEAMALQNPATVTTWHAAITCDNFLLSAWDTNPDFTDAPYYINSWSTEGANDNDGADNHSGFNVPFFEYWTSDANSLGEKTLTATMTGLEAGTYNVSAWVRVRTKNNVTDAPTGITFQANDGDAVSVCDGTLYTLDTSKFYIKNVTAEANVGEDGVLAIKFNVGSDNNISWLSFKNVKFELDKSDKSETLKYANNGSLCYDYDATVTDGTVYKFTGIYQNQVYGLAVKSIEAGKPYIAAGDITLTRAYNAAKVAGGTTDGNGFYGVAGGDADVTGLNNDNLIFYQGDLWHANNSTCSKGHGYFVISEIPTDATVTEGAKALFSLDLDEATGINAINGADANATIYNIAGQRVNNAKSGLFIINGKKVVK